MWQVLVDNHPTGSPTDFLDAISWLSSLSKRFPQHNIRIKYAPAAILYLS